MTAVTVLARILPLLAALVAALALGTTGSARVSTTGVSLSLLFGGRPTLDVTARGGNLLSVLSSGGASIVGKSPPAPPAQVTVDFAPGYTASTPAVGTTVGAASLLSLDSSQTPSFGAVNGAIITVDDAARYTDDPAALACAPGPYSAVWKLTASVFGLTYDMPLFVGHPADDAQRVELRFCPPPLTGSDGEPVTVKPVPLFLANFVLTTIVPPNGPGNYTSSAFIAPEDANGAPDQSAISEARFVAPVPHTVTVKGRYDAKTRTAVLTGRVTETGRPQAGAEVDVLQSPSSRPLPRHVRTSPAGSFTIRIPLKATATFVVFVPDSTRSCPGPSTAPAGCASLTVAGTVARVARVVVRR